MATLTTIKLTKDYGEYRGIFDLDITLDSGEIVGLLGPNGAGKSTLLKMLTKHTKPTSGTIKLFDKDFDSDVASLSFFEMVGFMPSEGGIIQELNTIQLFNYWKRFYRVDFKDRFFELLEILKIDSKTEIRNLSFGNRKKVSFLFAILHSPKLIMLDEPTAGLDPLMQKSVLAILSSLASAGSTVFLSSHTLSEVQSICDRLYILRDGRLVFSGLTRDAISKAEKEILVVNCTKDLASKIQKYKEVSSFEWIGIDFLAYTTEPNIILNDLLLNSGAEFYVERPTLEKTFRKFYE